MDLFSNIDVLKRSLDVSSTRQRLISNNISNVDTPGYKTMDVSFDDILNTEKKRISDGLEFQGNRSDSRHFVIGQSEDSARPKVIVQDDTSMLINENNVDIDYQMAILAENNIYYNTLSEITSKEFSMLRYVITEGR